MSEVISFPGLGLSFEVSRVAFSIGGYNIYWYGITFALGFLVGQCMRQSKGQGNPAVIRELLEKALG